MELNDLSSSIYEFGEFTLDAGKRLLNRRGSAVQLMPKAFDTLLYLVENNGRVIEKDELMRAIWPDTVVEENNLNQNISILRRIFGEKRGEHRYIATIPSKGYKFVANVTNAAERANDLPSTDQNVSDIESQDPKTLARYSKRPAFRTAPAIAIILGIVILASLMLYSWRERTKKSGATIKTIAVLPFKPLLLENRDEVLEVGMAETLIFRLGGYREVAVLPLSSVRKFGGIDQNPSQAGRSLGADSVLDGSIQRWGNKIRVNVRLIKTVDGTTLWSDTFDEEFTDIFVVQDTISAKVVSALSLRLSSDERARLERRSTNNAKAYELFLRGRHHYYKITPADVSKSIDLYRQAIEIDPNYALAYAAIADAYRTQAIAAHGPSKLVCPQAKTMALRALELDGSLAEAYVALGWVAFLYDWDWAAAESYLDRAIKLAPNDAEPYRAYAHLLSNMGRHEEAIAASKKAKALAPLNLIIATLDGYFLLFGGRHDEAIESLKQTIELDTNSWIAPTALARVYTEQGRYDAAIALFKKAKESAGGSLEPVAQLGYALAKSGRPQEALAILDDLRALEGRGYVPNYFFAVVFQGLGDTEQAFAYLERSAQEREVQLGFINIDSRWDNLRSEKRFKNLIGTLHLGPV